MAWIADRDRELLLKAVREGGRLIFPCDLAATPEDALADLGRVIALSKAGYFHPSRPVEAIAKPGKEALQEFSLTRSGARLAKYVA